MASASNSVSSLTIGIDLGTTYCCVAVLRHSSHLPEVIESDYGKNTTPSYVAYAIDDDDGDDAEVDIVAGETAKDLAYDNPEDTFFDIKRLIGRLFDDPNIQKYKNLWPFHLVNIHGMVGVKVHGETLLPQTIAANLISHLKKGAEDYLRQTIDSAVVTVPVYFTNLQIGLTKDACTKAGFTNIQFILEPVAAAVAYGFSTSIKCNETRTCLIFDLGGGTFDVTVFQLDANKRVDIKATGGDDRLGGEDFNDLLVEYCINEFMQLHGVNLSDGKTSDDPEIRKKTARKLRRIRKECERQKCFLASTPKVVISLDGVYKNKQLVVPLTRSLFEELIGAHLKRSMRILEETLTKSGFEKEEINEVILVGGSSRIPKVRVMVEEYFNGQQVRRSIDTDEAVACGAAIHAYNVFKENGSSFSVIAAAEQTQDEPQSFETVSSVQIMTSALLTQTESQDQKIRRFPPRMQHAAVAVGNNIFSFGGINLNNHPTHSLKGPLDVYILNEDNFEAGWKKLTFKSGELNPNQRYWHTAVALNDLAFIFGGRDTQKNKYSNSTYCLDTNTLKWIKLKVSGNAPAGRYAHTSVIIRHQLIVFGGFAVTPEVHSLDLENLKWSTIETNGISPPLLEGHCATVYKDRFMLIFGGWDSKNCKRLNTLLSFDFCTKTWSIPKTSGTPPMERSGHCSFMKNGLMYIFGGYNSPLYLNDLFSYDPETMVWAEVTLTEEAPPYRDGAECIVLEDQVFIFGGEKSYREYMDDTWILPI